MPNTATPDPFFIVASGNGRRIPAMGFFGYKGEQGCQIIAASQYSFIVTDWASTIVWRCSVYNS